MGRTRFLPHSAPAVVSLLVQGKESGKLLTLPLLAADTSRQTPFGLSFARVGMITEI